MNREGRWDGVRRIGLGAILVVVGLISCATGPAPTGDTATGGGEDLPEWYLNPQSVYPDDVYLSAVGTGDSRRDAEQQAMASLSQIFESEIRVDSRTQERYRELATAEGNLSESEVQLAQSTNIRSNQTLLNVQYGEAAVDDMGRVHAIAYIERVPTAQVYRNLIQKNADQVASFLEQSRSSGSVIRRYAFLSAAGVIASGNEVLINQLDIIQPGFSQTVPLTYDYDRILQERVDLASEMRVSIAIEGDEGGRITDVIREALSEERFPVGSQSPTIEITGRVNLSPLELSGDFKSVSWVLTLDMSGPDGSSLVTYNNEDRASGVTLDSARAFAYQDMEEAVADDFVGAMRRYFDGVVLGN